MQLPSVAFLLLPVFAALGCWFYVHGRNTVAFKVLKLLHTAYALVLGFTLVALSVSTLNPNVNHSYEHWVQFFLTNMFVMLYAFTALPFLTGFIGSACLTSRRTNTSAAS